MSKALTTPEQRGEHEDVPDLYRARQRQRRQDEGQQHGRRLRGDDDAAAAVPVRDRAADRSQQEDRNLAGEADQPSSTAEPVSR